MRPLREWISSLLDNEPHERFLFRVDAGRLTGLSFGHLSRCLILSRVLRELYGCETMFLMRDFAEGVRFALDSNETVRTLPQNDYDSCDEGISVVDAADEIRADWLIIDLPYADMDTSYFSVLRRKGVRILFIDDCRFNNPGADVFLNSSILAFERMGKSYNDSARYLLGIEYFIFDEANLDVTPIGNERSLNVILTFGGSDPNNLTIRALKALADKEWDGVLFHVILGPGYSDIGSVEALVNECKCGFEVHINPPDIISMLKGCDLAVCSGGRTMYELLFLNKKFIPIASIEHEAETISAFMRRGLVDVGMKTWDSDGFVQALANGIYDVSKDSLDRSN